MRERSYAQEMPHPTGQILIDALDDAQVCDVAAAQDDERYHWNGYHTHHADGHRSIPSDHLHYGHGLWRRHDNVKTTFKVIGQEVRFHVCDESRATGARLCRRCRLRRARPVQGRLPAGRFELDPAISWEIDFRPGVTIALQQVIDPVLRFTLAVAPDIARRHVDRSQEHDHGRCIVVAVPCPGLE